MRPRDFRAEVFDEKQPEVNRFTAIKNAGENATDSFAKSYS
jgi:hypothetical protein